MSHPEPLTPADCNLRGFGWMPLDVQRLLDSDLFILSTGDEFKAAVALWAKAWAQVPAASLPNDDRLLAHLSGAGSNWPAVRAMALRGFVLCSDGRIYHQVLAEKALEAWEQREKSRARQRKWRERAAPADARDGDETVTSPSRDALRDDNVTDDRTGQDRDSTVEDISCNSEQPPGPDKSGARAEPRADRGSRLPVDWAPSEEDRAFAQHEGIDPEREAGSFRDYWHGKPGAAGRKSNWSATWRNWVRRSAERSRGGSGYGSGNRRRNGFAVLVEKRIAADRARAAGNPVLDLIADEEPSHRGSVGD